MTLGNMGDIVADYTGRDEWHDVYTITLGELIESGVFDWTRPELDWSDAAYDAAQYERVCSYFEERYYWREISLLPLKKWYQMLKTNLVYELMPKYKPLYARIAEGIDPLSESDEYYKGRRITSAYPETLLSGNSDYISDGVDFEEEKVRTGAFIDSYADYLERYKSIDTALVDELEEFFTCMYTFAVNGY